MPVGKPAIRSTKGGVVHPGVQNLLAKLGSDISLARRARSYSTEDMAERMGVDRGTLRRLEKGDPGVSLNTLAMALFVLGLQDHLETLVDRATDDVGLVAAAARLPQRVTRARRRARSKSGAGDDRPAPEPEGW